MQKNMIAFAFFQGGHPKKHSPVGKIIIFEVEKNGKGVVYIDDMGADGKSGGGSSSGSYSEGHHYGSESGSSCGLTPEEEDY